MARRNVYTEEYVYALKISTTQEYGCGYGHNFFLHIILAHLFG